MACWVPPPPLNRGPLKAVQGQIKGASDSQEQVFFGGEIFHGEENLATGRGPCG